MAMWGIVLNSIALFLSIAGIILSIVYGAAFFAANNPANLPKSADNDIAPITKQGPGVKKVYERDEIRDLVIGSTEDGVVTLLGQPDSKTTRVGDTIWTYREITRAPVTGKIDFSTEVVFRKGKVVRANSFPLDPGRR